MRHRIIRRAFALLVAVATVYTVNSLLHEYAFEVRTAVLGIPSWVALLGILLIAIGGGWLALDIILAGRPVDPETRRAIHKATED